MIGDSLWHTILALLTLAFCTVYVAVVIVRKRPLWQIAVALAFLVWGVYPQLHDWFTADASSGSAAPEGAAPAGGNASFMTLCARLPRDAKTCRCALAELQRRIGRVRYGQIASAHGTLPQRAVRVSIATCTDREPDGYTKVLAVARKRCEAESTPGPCACFISRFRARWSTATSRATDPAPPTEILRMEAQWAAACGVHVSTLP